MERLEALCKKYHVALCYLFGSQKETGKAILEGRRVEPTDPEADIDFAVLFKTPPRNALETYALLSIDLRSLYRPAGPIFFSCTRSTISSNSKRSGA